MEKKSSFWIVVRVTLLLAGLFQSAYFLRSVHGDFSKPSWSFPFAMAGLVAIGILFICFIQTVNPRALDKWAKPSWVLNPFNYKQPLQLFDLGGYYFLSIGIGCLVLGLAREPKTWLWEMPLGIAVGVLAGVRLCVLIFSDRFE